MPPTADDLVAAYVKLRDYMAVETKRFTEFLAPYKSKQDEIEFKLMEILNAQGANSLKTNHGTAYRSTIVTPKIVDREKYLDVVMENYDTFGAGMLQLAAPKKEAIEAYMEEHDGQLPAGVETSAFVRINVRRS